MTRSSKPTAELKQPRPFWESDEGPAEPTEELAPGDEVPTRIDGFELHEVLGEGGTSTVYAATDAEGRTWALKLSLPDAASVSAVREEARLMAAVRHPGVPRVRAAGALPSGRPWLVMERVEGRPLDEVLAREGRLEWARVRRVLVGALDALHALHAQGLVHRDVKPANLVLRRQVPGVALLDFGITRRTRGGVVAPTTAHTVRGTLEYMSPEQLAGAPLDARSDLFSLGVVAMEAATGAVPWRTSKQGLAARLASIRQGARLTRPRTIPAGDFEVLTRLLAVEAEDRLASAADALAALR